MNVKIVVKSMMALMVLEDFALNHVNNNTILNQKRISIIVVDFVEKNLENQRV